MILLEEIKNDFELFYSNTNEYKVKVDNLSNILNLKDKSRLRSDFLPTYLTGNYRGTNPKYALVSLNPGFNEKQNREEERLKNGTIENYFNFIINFYEIFYTHGMKSPYYTRIAKLFEGLDNIVLGSQKEIYEYYKRSLINIDLVPYHSTSFGLPIKLNNSQNSYLNNRFETILDFLSKINCKLAIFNGAYYKIFLQRYFQKNIQRSVINNKTWFSVFQINGINCLYFSRMITQAGSGVTYKDMKEVIAEKVKINFGFI